MHNQIVVGFEVNDDFLTKIERPKITNFNDCRKIRWDRGFVAISCMLVLVVLL